LDGLGLHAALEADFDRAGLEPGQRRRLQVLELELDSRRSGKDLLDVPVEGLLVQFGGDATATQTSDSAAAAAVRRVVRIMWLCSLG